jgi:hypothetical protein
MPRTFSIASFTTACLAAACLAPTALAQGVLKPVEALIVNPANRPVPVSIVPSAAPAAAMCWIDLSVTAPLPVARTGTSFPIGQLNCTEGVTRLDVHRAVASVRQFSSQNTSVHFNLIVGLGRPGAPGYVLDTPVASLSSGTPDLSLARPVRIDKNGTSFVLAEHFCSSGLPTIAAHCERTVFLIGTPVN